MHANNFTENSWESAVYIVPIFFSYKKQSESDMGVNT